MWDCRSWNIGSHSRRFAMMRLRSYLCAPNLILSLLIVNGCKKYCLCEQTHSSKLQLVFVIHSRQIVLDRQILRLCDKFSKSLFRIRLNSQIYSIRKASSNVFAYVWGGLYVERIEAIHSHTLAIFIVGQTFGPLCRISTYTNVL